MLYKYIMRISIAGFPNTGKSSIINSLKRSRACNVGAVPGVTRFVASLSCLYYTLSSVIVTLSFSNTLFCMFSNICFMSMMD